MQFQNICFASFYIWVNVGDINHIDMISVPNFFYLSLELQSRKMYFTEFPGVSIHIFAQNCWSFSFKKLWYNLSSKMFLTILFYLILVFFNISHFMIFLNLPASDCFWSSTYVTRTCTISLSDKHNLIMWIYSQVFPTLCLTYLL